MGQKAEKKKKNMDKTAGGKERDTIMIFKYLQHIMENIC